MSKYSMLVCIAGVRCRAFAEPHLHVVVVCCHQGAVLEICETASNVGKSSLCVTFICCLSLGHASNCEASLQCIVVLTVGFPPFF